MAAEAAVIGAILSQVETQLKLINGAGVYNYNVSSKVFHGPHPHTEVTLPAVYIVGAFEADTAFGGEAGGALGQFRREWVIPLIGFVSSADDEETRIVAAANLLGDIVRAIEADLGISSKVRDGQTVLTNAQVYSSGPPGAGSFGVCEVDLVVAYIVNTGV